MEHILRVPSLYKASFVVKEKLTHPRDSVRTAYHATGLLPAMSAQTMVEGGQNHNERNDGAPMRISVIAILNTVAMAGVLLAHQIKEPLPLMLQMVCMAVFISVISLVAFTYLSSNYKRASDLMLQVGVFSGSVASVAALVMILGIPFKVVSLAIFLSMLFVVIIANVFKPTT